uniref:Ovule protein n=1 Tax=Heterorhabditis bacteriophora TaxID=37862 RepID=A0A1I7X8A5_HETBA
MFSQIKFFLELCTISYLHIFRFVVNIQFRLWPNLDLGLMLEWKQVQKSKEMQLSVSSEDSPLATPPRALSPSDLSLTGNHLVSVLDLSKAMVTLGTCKLLLISIVLIQVCLFSEKIHKFTLGFLEPRPLPQRSTPASPMGKEWDNFGRSWIVRHL